MFHPATRRSAITPRRDHDGRLPLVDLPRDGRPVIVEIRERYEAPLDDRRLAVVYRYRRRHNGPVVSHYMVIDHRRPTPYLMDPFLRDAADPTVRSQHAPLDGATRQAAIEACDGGEAAFMERIETYERLHPDGRLRLNIVEAVGPEWLSAYLYQLTDDEAIAIGDEEDGDDHYATFFAGTEDGR